MTAIYRHLCTLTLALFATASAVAASPPNVIFLLADDQASISMGCYGNPDAITPNLDALSARGVTFDNHYVTTSICMASRASILTGKYEYAHGTNFRKGKLSTADFKKTYPLLLRKAGYLTAFAGKFGVDLESEELPVKDFDKWGGGPGQTSYVTAENESMASYAKEFPHATLSYGAFGRDFIREAKTTGKPFCLSISFKAPHMPSSPDPRFDDIYKGKKFERPANFGREFSKHLSPQSKTGRQWKRWQSWGYSDDYDGAMRRYHQLIYGIDQAVGMIVKELDAQGLAENTVIIYTSDNGFLNGSHGYGSKVLPYEESMSVPLIIYDPRHPSANQKLRSPALTANIDMAPTILTLAGLKIPEDVQGVNLLPLLDNPDKELREQISIMNCWGPDSTHFFGVVTPEWKYVYWPYEGDGMTVFEELFDMKKDKLELVNASDPEVLEEMRKRYDFAQEDLIERAIGKHRVYAKTFLRKEQAPQVNP